MVEDSAEGIYLNTYLFFIEIVAGVAVNASFIEVGFTLYVEVPQDFFKITIGGKIIFGGIVLGSRGRNFRRC